MFRKIYMTQISNLCLKFVSFTGQNIYCLKPKFSFSWASFSTEFILNITSKYFPDKLYLSNLYNLCKWNGLESFMIFSVTVVVTYFSFTSYSIFYLEPLNDLLLLTLWLILNICAIITFCILLIFYRMLYICTKKGSAGLLTYYVGVNTNLFKFNIKKDSDTKI